MKQPSKKANTANEQLTLVLSATIKYEDKLKTRLDRYLADILDDWTRSQIKLQIDDGGVLINGKPATKAGAELKQDDVITLNFRQDNRLSDTQPEDIQLDIVYEDNDMAVINKPQGMVVHPAPGSYSHTLVNALLFHFAHLSSGSSGIRPGIVHRIDKDTSGLLVVAKNNQAHQNLAEQIAEHSAHRHYIALLEGTLQDDDGTIDAPVGRCPNDRKKMDIVQTGKAAVTHYHVLQRYNGYTLTEFVLQTGRTHQIRVHAKYIGHPVVGDKTYGFLKQKFKLNGQLLHAYKLVLTHPATGKDMEFTCELPDYFEQTIKKLKKL